MNPSQEYLGKSKKKWCVLVEYILYMRDHVSYGQYYFEGHSLMCRPYGNST